MEMSGAKIVWSMLKEEGVEYVFGIPGVTNISFLHTLTQMPGMRFINAPHESVCLGMADGYARASGKLGVVLVHNTPGVSNVMGNLHNAYCAGTPILVLAGQTDLPLEWSEHFMDVNFLPMMSQVTKWCWAVSRAGDIPIALNRAVKEAITPPTGPVFLSIPSSMQAQTVPYNPLPPQGRRVAMDISPGREELEKTARLLIEADKPVIFAGHAVPDDGAVSELVKLAETIAAPVYTCSETKLIFPTNHPLYRGQAPQSSDMLRQIISSADVLLAVGSGLFRTYDYSEIPVISATTKLIQVDLDPQALARFFPTEVALLASPKIAVSALAATAEGLLSTKQRQERRQRLEHFASARRQKKASLDTLLGKDWEAMPIGWGGAIKEIAAALPPSAAVIDELSSMYGLLSQVMEFRDLGSYYFCVDYLGWGLPAALGVALGGSRKPVVAMLGDGGALFSIQALWTAARYQIPAVIVVFNNQGYGCIRDLLTYYSMTVPPQLSSAECANYDIGSVSLAKLASDFGINAQRIENPTEIRPALEKAIALEKPALLEIMINPDKGPMLELGSVLFG